MLEFLKRLLGIFADDVPAPSQESPQPVSSAPAASVPTKPAANAENVIIRWTSAVSQAVAPVLRRPAENHPPLETWTCANENFPSEHVTSRTWKDLHTLILSGKAPPGITVYGGKNSAAGFSGSRISVLPASFTVMASFDLRECTRLRRIGENLVVFGDLQIGGYSFHEGTGKNTSPLKTLPEGLRVGGSLDISNCEWLEELPNKFHVAKSIRIRSCPKFKRLPENLTVEEDLVICGGASLTELPGNLRVRRDLRISGTGITKLPTDLKVGGSLIVEGRSKLAEIPESIVVGGDLVLRHCKVQTLPAHLRLAGSLRLQGASANIDLPPYSVPKVLDLEGCEKLEELPTGIFAHHLKLRGCTSLKRLPVGLRVPGVVDLRQCRSLTVLPPDMCVGYGLKDGLRHVVSLVLTGCTSLTTLPENLRVQGNVEVAGSGLRELPASLSKLQLCWRGVRVPHDVVFQIHSLPPERVFGEPNAELRRVIMERIGASKLLAAAKAVTVDADTDPGGERKLMRLRLRSLPELMYLFCRCPSTKREYLLRVPLEMRTCRQAAAWIAGFDDPDRYQPLKET